MDYPDLTLFCATIAKGELQKLEHNDVRWITPSEIADFEFCPANAETLSKIGSRYKGEQQ